jgi:hypothetical protein
MIPKRSRGSDVGEGSFNATGQTMIKRNGPNHRRQFLPPAIVANIRPLHKGKSRLEPGRTWLAERRRCQAWT